MKFRYTLIFLTQPLALYFWQKMQDKECQRTWRHHVVGPKFCLWSSVNRMLLVASSAGFRVAVVPREWIPWLLWPLDQREDLENLMLGFPQYWAQINGTARLPPTDIELKAFILWSCSNIGKQYQTIINKSPKQKVEINKDWMH